MPEIILCPGCQRRLRLPDEVIGQTVKCPACGETFTARTGEEEFIPPSSPAAPTGEAPGWGEMPGSRYPSEEHSDWHDRRPDRRPQRSREYYNPNLKPHRGALVLTLGVLGIVVTGFLGLVAWHMATTDLDQIQRGLMDPEGESMTQAGRICGIIGSIRAVFDCCCLGFCCLGIGSDFRWLI